MHPIAKEACIMFDIKHLLGLLALAVDRNMSIDHA